MIGNFTINGVHCRTLGFNTLKSSYIKSPKPKIQQTEIPGSSDVFDTTEYGGFISYDRGEIFTELGGKFAKNHWPEKITEISRLVNGKLCKLVFDRDPDFYYLARASKVESNLTISRVGSIAITWTADPYKYEMFETGYPTEVDGVHIFEIMARDKPVSLEVEIVLDSEDDPFALGDIWVSYADSANAPTWNHRINIGPTDMFFQSQVTLPDFLFGNNKIYYVKVEGSCRVLLHYRGGVLY